jgi:predicted outer membrane repeat protein
MIVATVLLPAVGAHAVVRYVALDGSGTDGQSWASAYKTIQAAINDSLMVGGGEIHVKQGLYTKAVRIYGGYSGVDETRNWKTCQTTVDGGNTSPHCFNVTANATIDGFAIMQGSGLGNNSNGGGVNITNCAATITNCLFKYNHSAGFGGALATLMGTGTRIASCTFNQNTASQCGGAIYNELGTSIQITDCTFTQNAADDSGGAIHNIKSNMTITGCVFQANRAAQTTLGVGGGILNEESSPVITNCVFTGNRAPYGVGIFNYLGAATIDGCLFTSCDSSALSGGGVYNNGGSPTIKNCLFELNAVKNQGGGMMCAGATAKTINCVFWKNSAAYGGGAIYVAKSSDANSTGTPQFINCTLYENSTGWRGGGVCNDSTPATFLNCIIWGNSASDANPGIYAAAGWSSDKPAARYCDIEGDSLYPGTGNLRADPKIGGDPSQGDFSLAFDSPCLDTGNNAAILGFATDYDNAKRIVDGDGNGSAIVDMGACELQGQPDHLTHGEIMQSTVYDSPTASSPTYTFLLRMETDDALTSIDFLAPGGSTVYKIPSDSQTSSGNVTTYHRVQDKKTHVWEYWVKTATAADLSAYGDGTYRITGHYRNGTQAQTQIAYFVPGTSTAIPQPTQKPQVISPTVGATVGSPVTFKWDACTDAAANSVHMTVIDSSTNEETASDVLAKTATESNAYTLKEGTYNVEVGFANQYETTSSDGTPFEYGKTVLVGHEITVPYTAVYLFVAPSVDAHFLTASEAEKKTVMDNWPDYWSYKGVAFNACLTKSNDRLFPVYRFWSGRSHFYTISETERSTILTYYPGIWTPEGIAFYAYPEGTEPAECKAVYRFWNTGTGTHLFTMDEAEATQIMTQYSYLYTYEGVAFYAYPP